MTHRLALLLMIVAASVFIVSTAAMLRGLEPFATWYYSFGWWSYIVFADAWLGRRLAPATVLRNTETPRLVTLSIAIWAPHEPRGGSICRLVSPPCFFGAASWRV
jgi:hypothetical protein